MRADRLLEIILLLQSKGMTTATALAHELAVSERTIYRDLDALNRGGIPIYTQGGPGGGCGLPEHYRTLLTGVSSGDIGTVLMASAVGPLADLGLEKKVQAALHKLVAALPASQRSTADRYRQRLHLDSAPWFRRAEDVPYLAILQEAIETEQWVHLRYRPIDRLAGERIFAPYGLVAKASIWYVVGVVEDKFRVYRVSRILAASLSDKTFTRPKDFDLASYWAAWCAAYEAGIPRFTATLHLVPELAAALQSSLPIPVVKFSPSTEHSPEEQLFAVTFETIEAACSWVLGCGAEVQVIAPAELREIILAKASKIAALYAQP